MKLTKTKKHIIELLEPYMNKIHTRGCMFKIDNDYAEVDVDYFDKDNYGYATSIGGFIQSIYSKENIDKIYGHYDITALLKYIKENGANISLGYDSIAISDKKNLFIGNLPNKPLHLYTEEEDRKLFKLLQKLGV